jgi:hypothetical protein
VPLLQRDHSRFQRLIFWTSWFLIIIDATFPLIIFSAIERSQARLDTKLRVLQQEYDDYLAQIRQILNAVTDVPFSRKRFVDHNIRGCHCNFCSSWSHHRWFNHRLQEVSDKRRLAYNQYDADWTYLVTLRTK